MTSDIPDSVSPELLQQMALKRRALQCKPPIGTAIPELPLNQDSVRAFDLVVAIEQMILQSRGCSPLCMLQAATFLIDSSVAVFQHEFNRLSTRNDALSALTSLKILGDISKLQHSSALLEEMIGPVTMASIAKDNPDVDWLEQIAMRQRGEKLPDFVRRMVISDQMLNALGIAPEDYDVYFRSPGAENATGDGH